MVHTISQSAAKVQDSQNLSPPAASYTTYTQSTIIKKQLLLWTRTDYHNQQNVTVSLLTIKAKAHSFYSDLAADEGGEKKGFMKS